MSGLEVKLSVDVSQNIRRHVRPFVSRESGIVYSQTSRRELNEKKETSDTLKRKIKPTQVFPACYLDLGC